MKKSRLKQATKAGNAVYGFPMPYLELAGTEDHESEDQLRAVDTLIPLLHEKANTNPKFEEPLMCSKIYQKALKGDLEAIIFWLTHRAGWKETR